MPSSRTANTGNDRRNHYHMRTARCAGRHRLRSSVLRPQGEDGMPRFAGALLRAALLAAGVLAALAAFETDAHAAERPAPSPGLLDAVTATVGEVAEAVAPDLPAQAKREVRPARPGKPAKAERPVKPAKPAAPGLIGKTVDHAVGHVKHATGRTVRAVGHIAEPLVRELDPVLRPVVDVAAPLPIVGPILDDLAQPAARLLPVRSAAPTPPAITPAAPRAADTGEDSPQRPHPTPAPAPAQPAGATAASAQPAGVPHLYGGPPEPTPLDARAGPQPPTVDSAPAPGSATDPQPRALAPPARDERAAGRAPTPGVRPA